MCSPNLFTFAHYLKNNQDIIITFSFMFHFHRNTKRSMATLWRTLRHWMSTLTCYGVTVSASQFLWWTEQTSTWPSRPPWTHDLKPATSVQIDTSGFYKRGTNANVLTVQSDFFARYKVHYIDFCDLQGLWFVLHFRTYRLLYMISS